MYRIELSQARKLTVNVTRGSGLSEIYIRWLDADGNRIRNSDYYSSSPYNDSMDLAAGIYYIEITPYNSSYTGTYDLKVTLN